MFKIASWNVNSLKMRLEQVIDWLKIQEIDILALQETKMIDDLFPKQVLEDLGYQIVFSGQPSYNGVAIISKLAIKDVVTDLAFYPDPQRRILAATVGDLRIINLYVPNGQDLLSEKFIYKSNWLKAITTFIKEQLILYPNLVVLGDFNIAPEDIDVHDPEVWKGSVHVSPEEREAFQAILALGLNDSFRQFPQDEKSFSWWDYRAGAFRRNHGLRIDHILLSESLQKRCLESCIDKSVRKLEKPSDHAPVWVSLSP